MFGFLKKSTAPNVSIDASKAKGASSAPIPAKTAPSTVSAPAIVNVPLTVEQPPVAAVACVLCKGIAPHLDTVDFSKSCEDHNGRRLPPSGLLIAYHLCQRCGFCFSPSMHGWTPEQFGKLVYNDSYSDVDPEYLGVRPRGNAEALEKTFGSHIKGLRHLDYGGGAGILSESLRASGWDSTTYDPFANRDVDVASLAQFDFITAYEVFEHVADVHGLFDTLSKLMKPDGLILFSTLLSDGNITQGKPLTWWYAGPRNGHISLFSRKTLDYLMITKDINGQSMNANAHLLYRELPPWALAALSPAN